MDFEPESLPNCVGTMTERLWVKLPALILAAVTSGRGMVNFSITELGYEPFSQSGVMDPLATLIQE